MNGCAVPRRGLLKQIPDMPVGTVGFEAIGKVDDDDFERAVEPVLRGEIAAGRKIRLLHLLGRTAGVRGRHAG